MNEIIFSEDGLYRYLFFQQWSTGKSIMFVGLNPSLSDGLNPTLKKCIRFAHDWGYGSCYMVNLFAYRAATPALLKKATEPIGNENDNWILNTACKVDKVIFAWGMHGNYLDRDKDLIQLFKKADCLGITKSGFPKHPLYLQSDTKPISFYL